MLKKTSFIYLWITYNHNPGQAYKQKDFSSVTSTPTAAAGEGFMLLIFPASLINEMLA